MEDIRFDGSLDTILQAQLETAKLYSTRYDFIKTLPQGIKYLEVGVLAGDFSMEVISATNPKLSVLVDYFEEDDHNHHEYGKKRWNDIKDHYDFMVQRFKNVKEVRLYKQPFERFVLMNSSKYDFIYIDANNSYEAVYKYLQEASKLLNNEGIIGINDYCIYENNTFAIDKKEIGVVKAVNKFLRHNFDWRVVGFALNDRLTSDIYIQKTNKDFLFRK